MRRVILKESGNYVHMKPRIKDLSWVIGNLFYAIAMDNGATLLDFARLKRVIVDNRWRGGDSTERLMVSSEGHAILLTIDSLLGQRVPFVQAFKHFESFFDDYPELFTEQLKHMITDTAVDIIEELRNKSATHQLTISELSRLLLPVYG